MIDYKRLGVVVALAAANAALAYFTAIPSPVAGSIASGLIIIVGALKSYAPGGAS